MRVRDPAAQRLGIHAGDGRRDRVGRADQPRFHVRHRALRPLRCVLRRLRPGLGRLARLVVPLGSGRRGAVWLWGINIRVRIAGRMLSARAWPGRAEAWNARK